VDEGETDPNRADDDDQVVDADGDGLGDDYEEKLGSDPNDADSDDDGLLDGEEPNPWQDVDGDGIINVLDPDSDGDGLLDGTEAGTDCSNPDTDRALCVADRDRGGTLTSVLLADTNRDGILDGYADRDRNGVIDDMDDRFVEGTVKGGGCSVSGPLGNGSPWGWLVVGYGLVAWGLAERRRRRGKGG
jgi:hypothetical protein